VIFSFTPPTPSLGLVYSSHAAFFLFCVCTSPVDLEFTRRVTFFFFFRYLPAADKLVQIKRGEVLLSPVGSFDSFARSQAELPVVSSSVTHHPHLLVSPMVHTLRPVHAFLEPPCNRGLAGVGSFSDRPDIISFPPMA